MKLTLAQLTSAGACHEQVALFRKTFGSSVEVTEVLCLQYASAFDFDWAADHLLTAPQCKAYDEATAPARKAYDEARALARKAYDEAIALALKAYDEALALAFARAYNS